VTDGPFDPLFPEKEGRKEFTKFGGDLVIFGDNIEINPVEGDFFRATSTVDPKTPMGQGLEMLSELFRKSK